MEKPLFGDVTTAIALKNPTVRDSVRSVLLSCGLHQVVTCLTFEQLKSTVLEELTDMVIVELSAQPDEIFDLVKSIRIGAYGTHSYAVLIAVTNNTDAGFVEEVLHAGFDDVIATPLSTGLFIDRLTHLLNHRKPFLMEQSYIGPDRRSDAGVSGKRKQVAGLIEAPNPLSVKGIDLDVGSRFESAVGEVRKIRTARMLEEAGAEIRQSVMHLIDEIRLEDEIGDDHKFKMEFRDTLLAYCDIIDEGSDMELVLADQRLLELIEVAEKRNMILWKEKLDTVKHIVGRISRARGLLV